MQPAPASPAHRGPCLPTALPASQALPAPRRASPSAAEVDILEGQRAGQEQVREHLPGPRPAEAGPGAGVPPDSLPQRCKRVTSWPCPFRFCGLASPPPVSPPSHLRAGSPSPSLAGEGHRLGLTPALSTQMDTTLVKPSHAPAGYQSLHTHPLIDVLKLGMGCPFHRRGD